MWYVAVLLIVIHILVCIAAYLLMRADILHGSKLSVAMAFFLPLWGPLSLLVQELHCRLRTQDAVREVGLEKLQINDEIHRSILQDEDAGADRIVPLEEALLINDIVTRRNLMMEVMYADPGDYVGQLLEARMNSDTEVVHYAVTALAELQKEYDLQFQKFDRLLARNPDDAAVLDEAIALHERYLSSGLLDGNARKLQLRSYSALLKRQLQKSESISLWNRKVNADILIGEYEEAYRGIERMLQVWWQDERGYLCLIRYYAQLKDRSGIDRVLRMLEEENVYLSPEGRGIVQFWGGKTVSADRKQEKEVSDFEGTEDCQAK